PPAEQEGAGALVDLVHDRPGFVVEVGPSAALEYAALVLFRPAGPLHYSVNGDLHGGRQFHGRSSLLAEFVVVRFQRNAAPSSAVAAESVRPMIPRSAAWRDRRAVRGRSVHQGGLGQEEGRPADRA